MLESAALGTDLGDPIISDDPDTPDDVTDDGHVYSMVNGHGIFAISASGQISFIAGAVDFESQETYQVLLENRVFREGRVLVIPFLKVLQFDILAKCW